VPLNDIERKIAPQLLILTLKGKMDIEDEVFTTTLPDLDDAPLAFNVTLAQKLAEGRELVEIPLEDMTKIALAYEFDPERAEAADDTIPGICATLWSPFEQCTILILIDGTHRCMRSLLNHRPFAVHRLSVEQSYACLLVAPTDVWAGRVLCVDETSYLNAQMEDRTDEA